MHDLVDLLGNERAIIRPAPVRSSRNNALLSAVLYVAILMAGAAVSVLLGAHEPGLTAPETFGP